MRGGGFGPGGMGGLGNLMKQAQKAMAEMQQLEQQLAQERVEASAGGGMVRVEATAAGLVESVRIDPQVVDPQDVEMLEDLVLSAVREALEKAGRLRQERMQQLTQGLPLPKGML